MAVHAPAWAAVGAAKAAWNQARVAAPNSFSTPSILPRRYDNKGLRLLPRLRGIEYVRGTLRVTS
jgi:hypothetical protein